MDPVTIGLVVGLGACVAFLGILVAYAIGSVSELEDDLACARECLAELNEDVLDLRDQSAKHRLIARERNEKLRHRAHYTSQRIDGQLEHILRQGRRIVALERNQPREVDHDSRFTESV